MKRIYACLCIVAVLLGVAFYSSWRVQKFAEDISDDIDDAMVEQIKQAMDLHTSTLCQALAARYLETGRLAGFLDRARALYGERCEALSAALRAELGPCVRFNRPEGGMFLEVASRHGVRFGQGHGGRQSRDADGAGQDRQSRR